MNYYTNLLAMVLLVSVGFTACGSEPKVSHGGAVLDYVSLIDSLRAAGAAVEPAGEISQPFFQVKGRMITVDGGDVQVFEYAKAGDAETEAEQVSPDGKWIGKNHVNWVATPHFYKKGKLIVVYVGDESAVTKTMEAVLGTQFAGG
jgi:hypothetical protein